MHTRVNTNDGKIVENVLRRNEYRLPEAFHPEDVVVDIGAHIGSFARACLARGVREIHCYEPHPDNYQHLLRNCSQWAYRRAKLYDRAVVVSGDRAALRIDKGNTGGHSTTWLPKTDGTLDVPAVSITEVLERARRTAPNKRIRLLKLDCEGAEYNLLYALLGGELDWIDEITGEIHSVGEEYLRIVSEHSFGEHTREALIDYLNGHGFTVETWNEMSDGLILFRAYRQETKTERPPTSGITIEQGADADPTDTNAPETGVPGTDAPVPPRGGRTRSSGRLRTRQGGGPDDTTDSTGV